MVERNVERQQHEPLQHFALSLEVGQKTLLHSSTTSGLAGKRIEQSVDLAVRQSPAGRVKRILDLRSHVCGKEPRLVEWETPPSRELEHLHG